MLDYLREYIDQHGYAPTLEEIGRHFRLASLATVHKHLRNLQRKRLIKRLPHQSRALEVVGPATASRAVTVPLLGRVAAGVPIEPVETPETVTLPEEMLGRGETFALRVSGDSMVGEGILDDDLVVVESRQDAPNGATVVALVRGDATVKKLHRERGRVRQHARRGFLRAAHESLDQIEDHRDEENADRRGEQHAGKDPGAERVTASGSRAVRDHEG